MNHGKHTVHANNDADSSLTTPSKEHMGATSDVVLIVRSWLATSGATPDDAAKHYRRSSPVSEEVEEVRW